MLLTHLQLGRRSQEGCALVDGPLAVGWTRPGIIGFGGFDDHAEAHAAATAAAVVLAQWSSTRAAGATPVEFPGSLTPEEAVLVEERAVARVVDPASVSADVPGHGFEIAVPHAMWLAVMLELAQRIHSTLLGSRRAAPMTEGVGA